MQSYHIDLATILLVLSQHSGELRATSIRVPRTKEVCQAIVTIQRGKVVKCIVENKNRQVLYTDKDALQLLQNMGELDWVYTPSSQVIASAPSRSQPLPPVQVPSPPPPLKVFPRRLRLVEQSEFASWPRPYRAVYNLIDGSKSIDEIAHLLSAPVERVREVIAALCSLGVVAL